MGVVKRRLLIIESASRHWHLETLRAGSLAQDPREDYGFLSGEPLCQYLLRRDKDALIITRGPLPFLAGNKATLGYISPLTGLPHYSFVGGRVAAQLLSLGLDAIAFKSKTPAAQSSIPYIVISGRAPGLSIQFKSADDLPRGQRSAYYWLLALELDGTSGTGSVLTAGDAAYKGFRSANLAADAIYHAGRGGCGGVFIRFAAALVLRGEPMEPHGFFPSEAADFARRPNAGIEPLLQRHCARFMRPDGGTIPKLAATGLGQRPTLPAANARQLGYIAADLGSPRVLKATRQGRTGCQWCPLDCRFTHSVEAGYAPGGRDLLLDDFEPAYALFAMLGLQPAGDSLEARIALRAEVDRRLVLPIEQMGLDVIDIGLALASLFEGVEAGVIPPKDLPPQLHNARIGDLDSVAQAVGLLRAADARSAGVLQSAVAHGPQALGEAYPGLRDRVFTSGPHTLGNAGHCGSLWTFLMPFSRFFGHYVGQLYKIDETLPAPGSGEEAYRACFERVVRTVLRKEFFWLLCNAFSMCAFTFVIFSQDGKGERLSDDELLVRILRNYSIHTTRADLEWFSRTFWAQSIDFKCQFGWRPPSATDFPRRVYEALSLALGRPPEELQTLMNLLIEEWKQQAREVMRQFGYEAAW